MRGLFAFVFLVCFAFLLVVLNLLLLLGGGDRSDRMGVADIVDSSRAFTEVRFVGSFVP